MKLHTVLILAGGDGGRFFPLEQKMRFRFNGKSLLRHIVESVSKISEEVVVVTNSINKSLIKNDLSACKVQFVTQIHEKGGMADAVNAAKQYLVKDVLILNGNDIFDYSILQKNIERTHEEDSLVGIISKRMDNYFPGGYVRFEGERAIEIIEKPVFENRPSDYVCLVAHYIKKSQLFIHELEKLKSSDSQFEQALSALIQKKPATCIKYDGDWQTLKYSWNVLSMQEYFFKHHLQKRVDSLKTIHNTALLEGDIYIGKNVTVGAYSKIVGPAYIGDNVTVGDHSLIRNSTVEQNSLIGSGCEVARSYLASGVMLHRNYVGDSVLSENVMMGAGAVTANYRFDEQTIKTPVENKIVDSQKCKLGLIAGKGVKIGINASTYPGVKISKGSVIFPGEIVRKDR